MTETVDVCVVGAGPAGLAAAARAAEHGLRVVLLDEQARPGGQYFRQVSPAVAATAGVHRPAGHALIARAIAAGVQVRTGTTVWGVADDGHSLLTYEYGRPDAGIDVLGARHAVIATGATERSLPFPGWTSPRVTWRINKEVSDNGCQTSGTSGTQISACGQSATDRMIERSGYGGGAPGRTPPQ